MSQVTTLVQSSTATSVTFQSPQQIGDNNSQGGQFGAASSYALGFFGATPTAQPAVGPGNIFGTSTTAGTITKYQITNSTTNPGASTTAERTSTATGLLTTDVVAVNKPALQAGLGVAGYRVSAANTIGITYTNISSGAITTTAEAYDILGVSAVFTTTAVLSPAAVPATPGSNEQVFSVPGATVGSLAIVNKPTAQAGLGISNVRVPAAGQVAITFLNNSSGAITPTASEVYSFAFLPNMPAIDAQLVYKVTQATTAIAASSASEITTAVTGLLATDAVLGVSKPTYQTGLGVVGYRVSSAGNLAITMMEVSSAVTTTLEPYSVTIQRYQAAAPFQVFTQSLAPVSVAATTTAEQTFAVNNLQASTSAFVNKPSFTPGLHVVGARVSGASTLAITYQNSNTTAVVPPTETYTIGTLALQGPGAVTTAGSTTNSISVAVSPQMNSVIDLRNALQALGLMNVV